jgi:hypothetical protein
LFVNSDRLAYYRCLMLADLGIVPDKHGAGVGDKFINDMFHWNKLVNLDSISISIHLTIFF